MADSIQNVIALDTPIQFVKGVGPRVADKLKEKNILVVEDLLYHLPFRYEDRLNPRALNELVPGEMASVIAEVRGTVLLRTKRMPIFEMTVGQGPASLKCMWFHGAYLKDKFQPGQMLALYGKVEPSRSRAGNFKMIQPQIEILPEILPGENNPAEILLEVGRIVPVYESLGGAQLSSRWLRRVIHRLLEDLGDTLPDTLPEALCRRMQLPSRMEALRHAHFPPAGTGLSLLQGAATPAHQRLIFEELFFLELGLELKRRRMRERLGLAFTADLRVREALKRVLPFHPTAAQKKVLAEIVGDLRQPTPMRRLLQGDVGSGKTIVALQAAFIAIENGYQAALMAPTEILATQHYLAARRLLERSTRQPAYNVVLLTGSQDDERKRTNRGRIVRGEADLVIGTHALIEEKVEFANLGLVIVDEQHRFGVMQRFRLMKKPNAAEPHVLVMTATPIPRTLALTLYGDLDVSVLDELPPGRTPIITRRVVDERAEEVWGFVHKQVAAGHQAYIVYPVIEGRKDDQPELDFAHDIEAEKVPRDSSKPGEKPAAKKKAGTKSGAKTRSLFNKTPAGEKPALKSAVAMCEELRTTHLAGLRLGLLHGRLNAEEKEVVMRRFQRGEIDVLVATTVIEVGVDVPNATVMVIEHAERFGLAQLHQLRGRVGRGAARSYCILMTGGKVSPQADERLNAMVRTQNGFELAELDLALRGPGEFFGTRQAGLPDFRVANLLRDRKMLELARMEATHFVETGEKDLSRASVETVWTHLRAHWQRHYGLVEAG